MDFILNEYEQYGLIQVLEDDLTSGKKYLSFNKHQYVICYFIYDVNLHSEYCIWPKLTYYNILDENFTFNTFYDIYYGFCKNFSHNKSMLNNTEKYFILSNYYMKSNNSYVGIIYTMYFYNKIPNNSMVFDLNTISTKFNDPTNNFEIAKIIYYEF